jgi:hypothetical protein
MKFRKRILEEARELSGAEKIALGGLGGAGLGALYHFAGDAGEGLQQDRTNELANWFNNQAREDVGAAKTIDKDSFTDLRDAVIQKGIPGVMKPLSWISGHTEDMGLGKTDSDLQVELTKLLKENPGVKLIPQPGAISDKLVINGQEVPISGASDNVYNEFKNNNILDSLKLKDTELQKEIQNLPSIRAKQDEMINDISDAKSDSLRNSLMGGTAAGLAGGFAARQASKNKQ